MIVNLGVILKNIIKLLAMGFISFIYNIRCPYKEKFIFGLHGFFASFGQGKTLTMCHIAKNLIKRNNTKGIETLVLSNMSTNFSEKLTSLDEIVKIAEEQEELNNLGKKRQVLILLDEIQTVFNSRAYQSLPIEIIAILCGNRHLNIAIFYTVQASFSMDKYFRELSNNFVYVRKLNSYLYSYYFIKNRKVLETMEEWCKLPPILFATNYFLINPQDPNNLFNSYNTKESMKDLILENKGEKCNKELFRKSSDFSQNDVDSRKKIFRTPTKKNKF